MNSLVTNILARADDGASVAQIAAFWDVSPGYVYGILREHRPDRQRKPRTRTSEKRRLILGLLSAGIRPLRVAFLAQCSYAYVARIREEVRP